MDPPSSQTDLQFGGDDGEANFSIGPVSSVSSPTGSQSQSQGSTNPFDTPNTTILDQGLSKSKDPPTPTTPTSPVTAARLHHGSKKNKKQLTPHNVDICITCVTDKPPQLPLREELPSLGIEVVYNAQGVGAKASKEEAKKLLDKFRKDSQYKESKKIRVFPPSEKHVQEKLRQRRELEEQLQIPKALSYEKYDKLRVSSMDSNDDNNNNDNGGDDDEDTASGSVSGSVSTSNTNGAESFTSAGEKRKHDMLVKANKRKKKKAAAGAQGHGLPMPLKFSFSSNRSQQKQQQLQLQQAEQDGSPMLAPLLFPNNSDSTSSRGASAQYNGGPPGGPSFPGSPITSVTNHDNTSSNVHSPLSPGSKTHSMFQTVFQAFSGERSTPTLTTATVMDPVLETPRHKKSRRDHGTGNTKRRGKDHLATVSMSESQSMTNEEEEESSTSYQTPSGSQTEEDEGRFHRRILRLKKSEGERSHDHTHASSHDVSRDPSSISTNFTAGNDQAKPVEVVASDPNIKRFLPDLQTVPSESSSGVSSSEENGMSETNGSTDGMMSGSASQESSSASHNGFSGDEQRQQRQYKRQYKQQQQYNKQQQQKIRSARQQQQQQQQQQRGKQPQQLPQHRQESHDTASQKQLNDAFAAFSIHGNNSAQIALYEALGPVTVTTKAKQHQQGTDTWMNTAKMAFENVAAEVYKQATEYSASGSSPTAAGSKQLITNQSTLSPTSTLSSNTAHLQQQHNVQIQGHPNFLFPGGHSPVTVLPTIADHDPQTPPQQQQHQHQKPQQPINYSSKSKGQHPHNHHEYVHNNNHNVVVDDDYFVRFPVLNNPFPTHPHVEVHVRPDGTQAIVSSSIGIKSATAFYEALQQPKTPVDSIERMLRVCPGLVKVRLQRSTNKHNGFGRLGLHTICARGFPTHHRLLQQQSSPSSTNLALTLVEDIQQLKRLISVLVDANRGACTVMDDHGDLPAHLLARTLMEWEAQWYEKVYEKVANDQDNDGRNAAAITKLYQSMSQCIEVVLHPVASFCNTISSGSQQDQSSNKNNICAATTLCRAPGSVGLLLPLHIASIFTASVPTLRRLLEQDPSAATIPCNLGHLRTFIPDQSLPLELHDKLSTDFPKWEIGAEARKSKSIQIAGGTNLMMEDYMRRSDLLFAFYPLLPRFRLEKARIERLEAKVIAEANQMDQQFTETGQRGSLSVAAKRIWIWMCTFQDDEEHQYQATYYPSVKRIIDSLAPSTMPYLSSVKTTQGKPLLQVAAPECQALLRAHLEKYESTQTSRLEQMVAKAVTSPESSSKASVADASIVESITTNTSACLSLKGKGYVGVLCRTLFHIHEDTMPTSFILLPYKLTKNDKGKLGIDKKSSAATAVKFAECLLQLTDPKIILYYLEQKSVQYSEQRIADVDDDVSIATKQKCHDIEESLMSLYASGKGYLYLIDELIGLPIVPSSGASLYPIELTQPQNIVHKLLPLMLTGMILMRGEKALSVLVNVLLDKSVRHVSQSWVDAAREIIAYLFSQQEGRSDRSLPGLTALIEELRNFVAKNSSAKSNSENSEGISSSKTEWAIELSILRMVVSMNDNKRSYAGLKAKRDEPGTVLWTKHRIEEEVRSSEKSTITGSTRTASMHAFADHADPPGVRAKHEVGGDSSSRASTKKSSNQGTSLSDPISSLNSSPSSPRDRPTPAGKKGERDIEKLRMQSALPDSPKKVSAGDSFEEERKLIQGVMDDLSLEDNDSGLDGEELAGVKILLDAEDGPSLLDQESTTEDDDGMDSDNTTTADKYKTAYDNESGNDSVKQESRKSSSVKISTSLSNDSTVEDQDVYVVAADSSPRNEDRQKNRPEEGKRNQRNEDSQKKRPEENQVIKRNEDNQKKRAEEEKRTQRDEDRQKNRPEEAKKNKHPQPESDLSNGSSDENKDHKPDADDWAESDSDNEGEEVILFDLTNERNDRNDGQIVVETRSICSRSAAESGRSADRLYDESGIEEIDHSDDPSGIPPGNPFESETLRLQDYALNRLSRQSTPSTPLGEQTPSTPSSKPTPSPLCSIENDKYALDSVPDFFGDLEPGAPITPYSSKCTPSPTSRSGTSSAPSMLSPSNTVFSRQIQHAKNLSETREDDDLMTRGSRSKRGSENCSPKNVTFLDLQEQLTDQALKVDCLETTLESIKNREDKLLSRGMMLQDFLSDLVDQSEGIKMDTETNAKRVERRLVTLEERILCSEIESQHLTLRVYAIEEETEEMAEEDYKRELCQIIEKQVKEREEFDRLDEAIHRSSALERMRRGRLPERSSSDDCDESLAALDGYNSNDGIDVISDLALDGYPSPHVSTRNDYNYQSSDIHRKNSHRDYDMSQLLRNASLDERSIEYEMGLAMFGTLENTERPTTAHDSGKKTNGRSLPRSNSMDAYERMRSEYQMAIPISTSPLVSSQDDASAYSGYSSAGEMLEMSSVEGFDLDWVKLSAQHLEVRQTAVLYQ